MSALEVIGGTATNPGAGGAIATPAAGDSFAIRNMVQGAQGYIEGFWAQEATPGFLQGTSPRFHDNVRGLRFRVPSASPRNLVADEFEQLTVSTDTPVWTISGGAAETDVFSLLMWYDNLTGINANLMSWQELMPQIESYMGLECSITSSATPGAWGPGQAINVTNDNMKANRSYALVGWEVSAAVCSVAIRGQDTGNVRIGGPGPVEPIETRDWLSSLSMAINKPCIPIIQANNRGTTLLDVLTNTASVATVVTLILALLAQG